ncbi:MAG: hypothetical protein ABSH48_13290 [Verrucomicrobiota bacterium]|jgi:hypothetical protein
MPWQLDIRQNSETASVLANYRAPEQGSITAAEINVQFAIAAFIAVCKLHRASREAAVTFQINGAFAANANALPGGTASA